MCVPRRQQPPGINREKPGSGQKSVGTRAAGHRVPGRRGPWAMPEGVQRPPRGLACPAGGHGGGDPSEPVRASPERRRSRRRSPAGEAPAAAHRAGRRRTSSERGARAGTHPRKQVSVAFAPRPRDALRRSRRPSLRRAWLLWGRREPGSPWPRSPRAAAATLSPGDSGSSARGPRTRLGCQARRRGVAARAALGLSPSPLLTE